MSDTSTAGSGPFPSSARVVVIGAGIVGNCLVGHLAELGWTDIVLLDKGPLPNPGGSTGHASNFIFPVDHNKEMAFLTLESQRQYEALGFNTTCGGIEVARTPERMQELERRMTSAAAWGIEAELLTPAQIKEKVPFINADILLGGFYTPSVSVVDSLETGTTMRRRAQEAGALQVFANTEVTAMEVTDGAITAVVTSRGRIECEQVAIACGVWSPRLAAMAGATIPLTPAVHQMADVGPIDILQQSGKEVAYPIVRDMDTFCYERQSAGSMEVGSYAHRPIFHRPDDIPSNAEAALSPTELPFTQDDFDPQLEQALELMGEILDDAEIRYAINGLLSLTPDAMPVLGETEVRNLWSAAAVWVKEGPGIAKLVAEWMTYGYPHLCDPEGSDINRLYPHERSWDHIEARCAEHFNKTYGIVHPREQWGTRRRQFTSPFYEREQALGAEFFEARGWERPQWYNHNAPLVERYGVPDRPAEWDRRWWSPIQMAEHLALREHVGMVDLSAFQIFDLDGPGALDLVQRLAVNQCDVPVGRGVYTPFLTPGGGFHSDLTIMRLADDRFRVDHRRLRRGPGPGLDPAPDAGRRGATSRSPTAAGSCARSGCGAPTPAAVVGSLTECRSVAERLRLRHGAARHLVAGVEATLFRISYVGDAGWEITTSWADGPALWDALWEAGQPHGIVPVGIGVYGLSGRLEKGYRLMGAELESEYNPVEAGLARPRVKAADFVGKEAYLAAREEEPAARLCTLVVEDNRDSIGPAPLHDGRQRAACSRRPAGGSWTARAGWPGSRRPGRPPRSASTC